MNWQSFGRATPSSPSRNRALQLMLEALEERQVPALLLAAGSEAFADDPTLLKYPGLTTPYTGDRLLVEVGGTDGLNYFKSLIQTQPADIKKVVDFSTSKVIWETPTSTMLRIDLIGNVDPVGAAAAIDLLPRVQFASLNFVYRKEEGYGPASYSPNDPFASLQNQSQSLEAYRAWENARGTGTLGNLTYQPIVAVTDTGTDIDHEDLKNSLWTNAGEIPGNNFDDDNNGYIDDINGVDISKRFFGPGSKPAGNVRPDDPAWDDHGTHVAGLIAAEMDNALGVAGVAGGGQIQPDGSTAPGGGARIMTVKWEGSFSTTRYDSTIIIEGLNYAYENNADIVNTSFIILNGQAPIQGGGLTLSDDFGVINAYKNLHDKGVISFVASANDDLNVSQALDKIPYVVWVSATNRTDVKASYSNYGTSIDISAPGGDFVDSQGNFDPTGELYSTLPGDNYGYSAGTSMASPVAAGVAALIKAAHPDWTRDQIVSQIYATATNIYNLPGNAAYQDQLGHGRINAFTGSTASTGFAMVATGTTIRAAADLDGTVKIWSLAGNLEQVISVTPGTALTSIDLDGDTRMAVGSADGTISYFTRLSANTNTWFSLASKVTVEAGSRVVGLKLGANLGPTNNLVGIAFAVSEKGTLVRQDFVQNLSTKIEVGPAAGLTLNSDQSLIAVVSVAGGFLTVAPTLVGVPTLYVGALGQTTVVEFSPTNPNTVVEGDNLGNVSVWNLGATPATSRVLPLDTNSAITALSLSGNNVVFGHANGTVYVRNVNSGALVNQLFIPLGEIHDGSGKVLILPDGTNARDSISSVLLISGGSEVLIASLAKQVYKFTVSGTTVQSLPSGVVANAVAAYGAGVFGGTGNTRAVAGSNGVLYLGNATLINLNGITVSANPLTQVKWSANGLFLVVSDSAGLVFIVEPQQGAVTPLFDVSLTSPVTAFAISADSLSVATAAADGTIREWVVSTGQVSFQFPQAVNYPKASPGAVNDLVYAGTGKYLFSADSSGFVRIWNRDPLNPANKTANGSRQAKYVRVLGSSTEYGITKLQMSPNSQLVAVANAGGQVEIYDLISFRLISRNAMGGGAVQGISFTSNSQNYIVASTDVANVSDGLIRYFSANSGTQLSQIRKSIDGLTSFTVDPSQANATNLGLIVGYATGRLEQMRTPAVPVSKSLLGQGLLPGVKSIGNQPGMGSTISVIPKNIQVEFTGLLDTVGVEKGKPVQFRGRGPDGIFGTPDDRLVPLVSTTGYAIGSNNLNFQVEGVMMPDTYLLEVSSNIARSPFGVPLDGNGDGLPGGDYQGSVFTFTGEKGAAYGMVIDQNSVGIADRRVYDDLNANNRFDAIYVPAGELPTKTALATQVPRAIDDSKPTVAIIDVGSANGRKGTIINLSLKMTLRHSFLNDLTGYLQGPDGSRIELFSNLPVFTNVRGLQDIQFVNNPILPTLDRLIATSTKPITTGVVRPTGDLGQFNGLSTFGQWKFIIEDNVKLDSGYVQSWSLTFTTSESSSVRQVANPALGLVQYLTTTDANGNYQIPGLALGLGSVTSAPALLKLDNNSQDQARFGDFVTVLPSDGQRNILVTTGDAVVGNDFIQRLTSPTATLFQNGLPVNTVFIRDLDASFSLTAVLQAASRVRGPAFGTANDTISLYAQSIESKDAPMNLLVTLECINGQLKQAFANPFAGMTSAPADGTYKIFVVQTALGSHDSLPVLVGTTALDTTAPLAPAIQFVNPFNPLMNSVPTTNPILTGIGEPGATIEITQVGGSTVLGRGPVDAQGNFSVTLTTPLPQGSSTLVAYAIDAQSNKSPASVAFSFVVVSIGPVAPVITQVDGSAPPGGIYFTQFNTLNLKVTLESSGPMDILLNGVVFQTTSVVGPGAISLDLVGLPSTAINAPLVLTLIQHDDFSLTSPPSLPVLVVINAEVPIAAKVTNILTDTGRSSTDGITKDNLLTIRGLAQPYAVVALLMDGSNLGSVIADRTGSWTFPVVNLFIEGSYDLILNSISATGIAGPTNGTPGAPAFQIIVDLTNPLGPVVAPVVIPGINPLGLLPQGLDAQPNFTRVKTPTITGTVEPNAIVEILNGGVVIGSGLANGAGEFAVTIRVPLADGVQVVLLQATDVAGNISTQTAYSFTVQTSGYAPGSIVISGIRVDTGYSNADGITNLSPTEVFGVAPTGALIRLFADPGTPSAKLLGETTATAGVWTWTGVANLGEGSHTIQAIGIDPYGNQTLAKDYRLVIDQTAPSNTVINTLTSQTGRNSLGHTNRADFTVGGRAEPFAEIVITLEGGSLAATLNAVTYASASGTWMWAVPQETNLLDGTYKVTAITEDAAGNAQTRSPAVLSITLNRVAPAAPEILGVLKGDGTFGDATNQSGLTIRGTSVLGYLVSVFVNDQLVGYAIPEASGQWTLDNSQQTYPDGLYRLTAQATNQAGSVSPIGAALTVQILTVAPVAPVITGLNPQSVNSLIATNRPTISGTSAPNVWIHISIDQGAGIGSFVTRANSLGKWSYQTTALAQGPASVLALAKDNAGNQSGVSNRINFIVDSVAPEISVTGLGPNAQFNKQTIPISFGGQITEVGAGIHSVYTTVLGPNGLWYDGTGFVSSTPVWQPAQISGIAWNSLIQPSKMIQSLANPNGTYVLSVGGFDNIGNLRIVQSGVPDNMLALLESLRNIRIAEFGPGAFNDQITDSVTTFGYSDIRPTVTTFGILPGANNTQVGSLVFSAPVTGLTPSDFAVTGGMVTSLIGSGANYSFTLTRVGTGRLTVSVPEGVVFDAFGNTNLASKSIARVATFDTFTVFGTPAGVAPIVTLKQAGGPTKVHLAYGSAFKGGVQAAIGDFNLDGIPDVAVAPGKGGGPNIRIIDGATGAIIRSFMAFDSKYVGGVNIATGDVDDDGIPDIIATTNGGIKAQLRVFSGRSDNAVLPQFNPNPYGGFIGSVAVSTGDFNRDGLADIITVAGATGDVRVWSGNNGALAYQFAAILPTSLVPLIVVVASADTNRNGVAEVLVGVKGSGGTTIQTWDPGLSTTKPISNIQVTDQVFQSTFSLAPSVETLLGLRDVNGGQPYKSPADSLLSRWLQLR